MRAEPNNSMKMIENILSPCWVLFGLGLVINGIYEEIQFLSNPRIGSLSLMGWLLATGILPGVLAIILGVSLKKFKRLAKYLGISLSAILALYVWFYASQTSPENMFKVDALRFLQLFVLVLCGATVIFIFLYKRVSRIKKEKSD